MTRTRSSIKLPPLDITVEPRHGELAMREYSSKCMIAELIKEVFGSKSYPVVDADHIRFTDGDGRRRFYLTPPAAVALLVNFDSGILPTEPVRIRAVTGTMREARPKDRVTLKDVRAWAKNREELASRITPHGLVARDIVAAYELAHPGKYVVTQGKVLITSSSSTPVPEVKLPYSSKKAPPISILAGGLVPGSRRRTFGKREITQRLIDIGWRPPQDIGQSS